MRIAADEASGDSAAWQCGRGEAGLEFRSTIGLLPGPEISTMLGGELSLRSIHAATVSPTGAPPASMLGVALVVIAVVVWALTTLLANRRNERPLLAHMTRPAVALLMSVIFLVALALD